MYEGNIYCGRYEKNDKTDQEETVVVKYDLDGKNEEEVCCFDFYGNIFVCGDRIYCYGLYGEDVGKMATKITTADNCKIKLHIIL